MKTKISRTTRQPAAYIAAVEWCRFVSGMGGGGGFTKPRKAAGPAIALRESRR